MPDETETKALEQIKEYLDSGHSLDAIRQAGWGTWIDRLEGQGFDLRTGKRGLAPPGPSVQPTVDSLDAEVQSSSPPPFVSSKQAPSVPTAATSPPAAVTANTVQPGVGAIKSVASVPLIESDIRRRVDTDKQMSFGTYILWILGLSIFTLGLGVVVYWLIIEYQLIERRNEHFARQRSFYTNVIRVLREKNEIAKSQDALQTISRAEAELNEITIREGGDRNPWVWGVILPVLTLTISTLYTRWFLMADFRNHSVRQREISDTISQALRHATPQTNVSVVDESVVPDRNYWVFLLLTLVTFGLFGIYWQYVLFNDPNVHFARQAIAEDQLVSYLRVAA